MSNRIFKLVSKIPAVRTQHRWCRGRQGRGRATSGASGWKRTPSELGCARITGRTYRDAVLQKKNFGGLWICWRNMNMDLKCKECPTIEYIWNCWENRTRKDKSTRMKNVWSASWAASAVELDAHPSVTMMRSTWAGRSAAGFRAPCGLARM